MFQSNILKNYLKSADTIKTESIVIAEWNMNDPDNIKQLGNYRYRPTDNSSPYYLIPSTYTDIETGPVYFWTGATDSDTVIDSGLNNQDQPTVFLSPKTKMKLLYSLEDCIKPFRPRSGINKVLYLGTIGEQQGTGQYIDDGRADSARRPRYYMSSRDDQFKYWTSYRTEYGLPTPIPGNPAQPQIEREVVRGISFSFSPDGPYYIEDTAPFVVYEEMVPTNKIVVKVQTNVGEISLGNFRYGSTSGIADPLYGDSNKTTPQRWRIEALKGNSWMPIISFDENSTKPDGSPLFGADGYVEVSYGLQVPDVYKNIFSYVGEFPDATLLPDLANTGDSYLIKQNDSDIGIFYIYVNSTWESFIPEYNWNTSSEEFSKNSNYVTKFSNPEYYFSGTDKVYREFEFIKGLRLVVTTMNKSNCTFDLIEMSPRLVGNITDSVNNISITRPLSDLGSSSLPVGSLLAATGKLDIFDDTLAFNETNVFDEISNTGSIVSKYLDKIVKFVFYNNIKEVEYENVLLDFLIPQKTMYAYGFPQTTSPGNSLSLELRDFFFYLESSKAPQLFLTNISLSYVVMLLLDSIGFDNYVFKRNPGDQELIIPYFFVEPGQNVAEVLQKLAVASQSAMFFDEYNNFVVMSKEYLLPSEDNRATDITLLGQETVYDTEDNSYYLIDEVYDISEMQNNLVGAYVNISDNGIYVWENNQWNNVAQVERIERPNIIEFSTKENKFYNSGQINYTVRYLQRSIGSTSTAVKIDEYKNYIYKPSLLWEAPGNQIRQTVNELGGQSQAYVLGAVPLNSDLTEQLPYAYNNSIYNNIIDVGENVYWTVDFQGYFYANGEIIKYDALEYSVSGQTSPVWIKSNQEYQDYFGKLPFNGKMYPTGRIRIYTNPEYETIANSNELRLKDANPIPINGRGQFGTPVTSHSAGLNNDTFWTNNNNVYGCIQEASSYLFNINEYINYPPNLTNSESGKQKFSGANYINAKAYADQSGRNGVIKNFLTDKYFTEKEIAYKKTTEPGTVQSSALIFTGPDIPARLPTSNFVSYIYKDFINDDGTSTPYKHYGTRMRIVGTIDATTNKTQNALNSFPIFSGATSLDPNNSTVASASVNTNDAESIIRGGSGGIGFNVDKNKNTGYFFEIAALSVGDSSFYSDNNAKAINAEIISSPAPKSVNGTVTVYTKNQVPFEIGQTIIVYGLVDNADPQNTSTPLNGEFAVETIASDKKSFTYKIPSSSLTTTSQTGGSAVATVSSGTNFANIFFYKLLSCNKGNKISGYQRQSNVLTLYMLNQNYFQVGDEIKITLPAIQGEYTVLSSQNHVITVSSTGSNISLQLVQYTSSDPDNIYLKDAINIPYKLWSGLTAINVDSGQFYGQERLLGEQNTTVYDLAAEYINIGSSRRFYLYLNGKQVAVIDDENPLTEINSLALFTRGTSKCMFENVYALSRNYSQNTIAPVQKGIAQIFGDSEINSTEALRKYALSGIVQKTYLSGINSLEAPNYSMYFEEFGTILRQAAYFNVLYDRAYPALSAKLMKTVNRVKGVAISGFYAWSYGAEFLVFNCTDFAVKLDDTSGNFLKILGIAFTQNTSYSMTIDDLYKKRSNLLDTSLNKSPVLQSLTTINKEYNRIKNSIDKYGKNEFTIESPYIQSSNAAEDIFGWVVDKICKPRKMIGLTSFGTENIQLGDIVKINYINNDGINIISDSNTRFVVYHIEYTKDENGPKSNIFLAEV